MIFLPDDPILAIDPDTDVHMMQRLFNASSSSKRVFSEIHYHDPEDPHLTLGMGHWIRKNVTDLFVKLNSNKETWAFVTNSWADKLTVRQWQQIEKETASHVNDQSGLAMALSEVLCLENKSSSCVKTVLIPWADKVGEDFNSSEHWFTAGWKVVARAEPVAQCQVEHWVDSVLNPGVRAAEERNVSTRGGIACVISAKSSGLGSTMFDVGETEVSASGGGVNRKWSLNEVPVAVKSETGSQIDESRLLQDWRAVVAWQYYTVKKRRVRSRMRSIWNEFFSETWGDLEQPSSLAKSTEVPTHTGVYMDNRSFDFAFKFLESP